MNSLNSMKDWMRFLRNTAAVVVVVVIPFCWYSLHSGDEIAVVMAIPLMIGNCMPFLLHGVVKSIDKDKEEQPKRLTALLSAQPRRIRYLILGLAVAFGIVVLSFSAALAIFIASFAYGALGLTWAVHPARIWSGWLFAISILPIIGEACFLAGIYVAGKAKISIANILRLSIQKQNFYWQGL